MLNGTFVLRTTDWDTVQCRLQAKRLQKSQEQFHKIPILHK